MWNAGVVLQVCRLSSEDSESSAVDVTTAPDDVGNTEEPAAGLPRPRSNRRRSSHSGTSTGSDALSNNGLSDDTPVFDDGVSQPGVLPRAVKDRRPSTESAPPVPPPRRVAVPSGEVWQQRQIARPATDLVHRRILAVADNGPSSAPNSCPSSPLLDNVGSRRAGALQNGVGQSQVFSGRRTHPPPTQNDRDAAVMGSPRRTKLPLSPLVRSQRDVR